MSERFYEFNWDIIGDLQDGRPNLGDQVNLVLYRLMQSTFREVAVKKFGRENSDKLFRDAGGIAGKFFVEHFLETHKGLPLDGFREKLRAVLDEHGITFLRIDSVNEDKCKVVLSAATGIDGAGFGFIEVDDCYYDIGFVEGIFTKYMDKDYKVGLNNDSTIPKIFSKLGDQINLIPYRLLQYTIRDVVEQIIGTEPCNQFFYDAGEAAGKFFAENFLAEFKKLPLGGFVGELQRVLKELGVGILRVEKADTEVGEFVLTVSEDLDCSGLPDLGTEVCNYDEGFIAGIFFIFTGVVFKAKEVDCWCSGDRTCRFVVKRV